MAKIARKKETVQPAAPKSAPKARARSVKKKDVPPAPLTVKRKAASVKRKKPATQATVRRVKKKPAVKTNRDNISLHAPILLTPDMQLGLTSSPSVPAHLKSLLKTDVARIWRRHKTALFRAGAACGLATTALVQEFGVARALTTTPASAVLAPVVAAVISTMTFCPAKAHPSTAPRSFKTQEKCVTVFNKALRLLVLIKRAKMPIRSYLHGAWVDVSAFAAPHLKQALSNF